MSVAKVITVAPIGVSGSIVEVESDSSNSLPSLQIVGLGNKAIDEAKERVRSAINNSLLDFPKKKLTINLAPAELPKDGAHYDLPIALAILAVSGQVLQSELTNSVFAGELALNGDLRPIKGAINVVELAKNNGFKTVYLPVQNLSQAKLIEGMEIIGVKSLKELFLHLKKELVIKSSENDSKTSIASKNLDYSPLLDDIKGQEQAKRALIIAAAGHHNLLMTGPPGAGKTLLAKTLANLLFDLSPAEQIESTKIHSLAGKISGELIHKRPFRAPHHTSSAIAIIGGGNPPKPGEISLAHNGVLFLDEILEYPRSVLESLRQPLEDKKVDISRANSSVSFPANFMLIGTMNPCPCGYFGDTKKECVCSSTQILAYQKRLSGPLLDRIDMVINVSRVPNSDLLNDKPLSSSQHTEVLGLINKAVEAQFARYNRSGYYNSSLVSRDIKHLTKLSIDAEQLLLRAAEKLSLSARSYFKVIKIARTIADLEDSSIIEPSHLSEALQYRKQ